MPQPNFVPVRFRESRITQSKGVDGGSSTVTGLPLTVNEIKERLLPCKILCERLDISKRKCDATKHAPILGAPSQTRGVCAYRVCDKNKFRATRTTRRRWHCRRQENSDG